MTKVKSSKLFMIFILVIALLACFAFTGCDETPSGNTNNNTGNIEAGENGANNNNEPAVNMTQSYSTARQNFQAISGYWLPELSNIEVRYSNFDAQNKSARVDLLGDSEFFGTVLTYLKNIFPENPQIEDNASAYFEFEAVVNAVSARYNVWADFVSPTVGDSYTSIHVMIRNLYDVTLNAGVGGSVTLQMGGTTYPANSASVTAGDNLILTATPDSNYAFKGWYVGTNLLSTNNPYTYVVQEQDADIEGRFEENTVQMTQSYSEARTSFQTATGLVLPELASVAGMFEDLGSSMYMVDISGATASTLTSVISAFNEQTSQDSIIDGYGKNVWIYNQEENEVTYNCELSCFLAENIVVVMFSKVVQPEMTQSYSEARDEFYDFIGVLLPAVSGLVVDDYPYEPGVTTSYCFDMFEGDNLSEEAFDIFKDFFDNLAGWTLQSHDGNGNASEYYETYAYATTGASIDLVLAKHGEHGDVFGIFMNGFID